MHTGDHVLAMVNDLHVIFGKGPGGLAVCYLLSTALDFPEEEGMMQQSSVSISLSF